jgi:hypothetical protein
MAFISLSPSSPITVANIHPSPRSMDPTHSVMPTGKRPKVTVPGMPPRPIAMRPMTRNPNVTEATHVSEMTHVAEMTHTMHRSEMTHVTAHVSEMSAAMTAAAVAATPMAAPAMTATVTS